MIYGIGTDLCDIRRLQTLANRPNGPGLPRFSEKILGEQERALFEARQQARADAGLRFLGTRFAAKEALGKALGLGMRAPMRWHDCQVLPQQQGRPGFDFKGELAAWLQAHQLRAWVSLSDERHYALAFVVVEHDFAKPA